MTTKMWSGWMAAGVMAVAMASAGAQQGMAQQGGTSGTVKDDLFAGTEVFAKGASDIQEITMDPDTLGMVGGTNSKRAHTMVLNVVRTYTYDKPGMYRIEDVDAFRNKLNTGDWHCSVHTRSLKSGESTDVCSKHRTDDLSETAIISVEPKELTFIHTIRKKGPGEGDHGDMGEMQMPMLMQMHGMSSLAAMDPEAFIDMKLATIRMKTMNLGRMNAMNMAQEPIMIHLQDFAPLSDGRLDGMEVRLDGMKRGQGSVRIVPKPEAAPTIPAAPVAPKP